MGCFCLFCFCLFCFFCFVHRFCFFQVSPCVSDREKARAAQTVLINRGFLNGAADGQFGPRSLAGKLFLFFFFFFVLFFKIALNAFNLRNNRPSATCLTEAAFSALTGQ
jgi:hypothetical protein